MKLRIQDSSLRLRLSEQDLQQFAQTGRVESVIVFGPDQEQSLHYILTQREAVAAITVEFTGKMVLITIPDSVAAAWVSNSETGLSGVVDNGTEKGLRVLIEKDQHCRH